MNTWPVTWISQAMAAAGLEDSIPVMRVMLAWQKSTPLPAYSNNPIGMPAGASGAPGYLNTGYAIFPTMSAFYSAFANFIRTYTGGQLASALRSDNPYASAWRTIHALEWPGSSTETDYPSMVLDLTAASYQASVGASPSASRKTSGVVTAPNANRTTILAQAASVNQATQALTDTGEQVRSLLRKHARNVS